MLRYGSQSDTHLAERPFNGKSLYSYLGTRIFGNLTSAWCLGNFHFVGLSSNLLRIIFMVVVTGKIMWRPQVCSKICAPFWNAYDLRNTKRLEVPVRIFYTFRALSAAPKASLDSKSFSEGPNNFG